MNPPVSVAARLPEVAKSFLGVDIEKLPSSISRTSSFLHSTPYSTSSQRMLTKSRNLLQGRIYQGGKNLTWHRSMLLNVLERWTTPKITPFRWGSRPHLIHGSVGPRVSPPHTASRSYKPFLQGSRTRPTHRQTDHVTAVCCNRPSSLAIAAMRPNTNLTLIIIGMVWYGIVGFNVPLDTL